MRIFYSARYTLALPAEHRFPIAKYGMLRERLLADGTVQSDEIEESPLASVGEIEHAHDPDYVARVANGTLSRDEIRRIGFPWSEALYLRSLATCGGALASARAALARGVAGNLAGGTHHAHADFGSGFCVFNDLAVAALVLLAEGAVRRVAILDADVHQGDGNAAILGARADVRIADVYGAKNFPFRKVVPSFAWPLPTGAGDAEYLAAIDEALGAIEAFAPDLVLFQMGVDALASDALGTLSVTPAGMAERDRRVAMAARRSGWPVSLALGGGYSRPIEPTVDAYATTFRVFRDELAPRRAAFSLSADV